MYPCIARSLRFSVQKASRTSLSLIPCHSVVISSDLVQPRRTFSFFTSTGYQSEDASHVRLLRYAHENSYLSWSRNAVICAGVGATVHLMATTDASFCRYLETGFMDLGVVFMTLGSLHHIATSAYLRSELGISWPGFGWILLYTSAIWLFYIKVVPSQLKKAVWEF